MSTDFDAGRLRAAAHRPWPMPAGPWLVSQTWHDLLFAHWAIEPELVARQVPATLPLDVFEGRAWIGIVPFRMTNVSLRGMPPLPGLSAFPEINVRTYVTLDGKPGVYFFSLDAASRPAVYAARLLFRLPYFAADISVSAAAGSIEYRSVRRDRRGRPAQFLGRYRPLGEAFSPARGSLEWFLTERYCLYATDGRGRPLRADIHHREWRLQAADAEIDIDTMAEAAAVPLPAERPLLHFARRQDAVAWPVRRA